MQHYSHLFYSKLTKGEFRPAWLNEGLAYYLDGRDKNFPIKQDRKLAATEYFCNHDGYVYWPGSFMVKTLLDKFGKEKLLNLIKKIRPGLTEDSFCELFKNIYGFSFTKDDLKKIID